jgi:hypothetical protein
LAEIRARAAELRYNLAARWKIAQTTVRQLGVRQWAKHRRRRYRDEWVVAYEELSGRSAP